MTAALRVVEPDATMDEELRHQPHSCEDWCQDHAEDRAGVRGREHVASDDCGRIVGGNDEVFLMKDGRGVYVTLSPDTQLEIWGRKDMQVDAAYRLGLAVLTAARIGLSPRYRPTPPKSRVR